MEYEMLGVLGILDASVPYPSDDIGLASYGNVCITRNGLNRVRRFRESRVAREAMTGLAA